MVTSVRRGILYAALLAFLALIGAQAWISFGELGDRMARFRASSIEASDGHRFEVEYYRLREGVARYVGGDPKLDLEALSLRVDVFWARAVNVSQGPYFEEFRQHARFGELSTDLIAVLTELEPLIIGLERGDLETAAMIQDRLLPFEQRFADSDVLTVQRRYALREAISGMVTELDVVGSAFGVVVTSALVLFGLETFQARRAERTVRQREERVTYLAHHDTLTGLANRNLLAHRLRDAVATAQARGDPVFLMAIDLDGFKNINDSFGHSTGDRLLEVVAQRLLHTVKATDTVARLGGDEFALVIQEDQATTGAIASRIIEALERPITIDARELYISASIGIAGHATDNQSSESLLQQADLALYQAKAAGRRTYRFFAKEMNDELQLRRQLEEDLRRALTDPSAGFHLVYQPQIRLADATIIGVEALLRWQHPTRGNIPPDVFIPIAEESGLILELGRWVTRSACAAADTWKREGNGVRLSINLSPVQFGHQSLLEELDAVLADSGLIPADLVLEITEGVLMGDVQASIDLLHTLRDRGFCLAIDDFGKGYSSLNYLKSFPIDHLKIDRAFVSDIETDADDRAIIQGIVGLGQSLGMSIIAEGVETDAQRAYLVELGCDEAQGYFFSRPVSAAEITIMLASAADQADDLQLSV